ncbi:Protein MS5 [Arabidopsis thaliana x Arabidopsis arenosa]|uniref:Protein MS5 n=1 Tax=Arabidopsis thaliana x Arabidopsis arenosa TaxID=1240361 RepID=A0A8T1ZJX9_9BRAS|nr:Protein MS5 [Arabidopsis thaliana x Arabidopsis arenosa]
MLDSGKLSDETCHSILCGLGKHVDALHLSKTEEEVDGWTSEEDEQLDEEYCRQVTESLGFDIDGNVRIPACGISPVFLGANENPRSEIALYGQLGVHCFNIDKERKLKYMRIPKYNIQFPKAMNGEHLRVSTGICRIKPETPEGDICLVDEEAIDKFYRGVMPNFVSKEGAVNDKLRFYEVQEQDICANDWLRLYTEFALFSFWRYNEDGFESCLPVEIKKIIVETCENHREPRLKLKSSNAIFHINFSAKSCDYKSVVRRTTDGKPGHIVLEINTWKNDQPSST